MSDKKHAVQGIECEYCPDRLRAPAPEPSGDVPHTFEEWWAIPTPGDRVMLERDKPLYLMAWNAALLSRPTPGEAGLREALEDVTSIYYQRDVPHQSQHPHCRCRKCVDAKVRAALAQPAAPQGERSGTLPPDLVAYYEKIAKEEYPEPDKPEGWPSWKAKAEEMQRNWEGATQTHIHERARADDLERQLTELRDRQPDSKEGQG